MSFIADPYFLYESANVTTSPLLASATWTGTAENNEYPSIIVNIETDTDGYLYIGFSVDGTNWKEEELYIDHEVYSYEFKREKTAPYFRLRYVNGTTDQTFFRLYSYYTSGHRAIPIERSKSNNEGVAIYDQDQDTFPLDLYFLQEIDTQTLTVVPVIGTYDVTLASAAAASIGDVIELACDLKGERFMQAEILNIVGNVVTMDTPVNCPYDIATTTVVISTREMNVDGSVTPQVFSIKPLPQQKGDIIRAICIITDSSDMDFESFGGISGGLTRGIVLRKNNGNGTYRNIANFKNNGDIENYAYDAKYFTNIGGGVRGFSARMTWNGKDKHGVVIRLEGVIDQSFEIVIQDDLTPLNSMRWIGQGSELQGR